MEAAPDLRISAGRPLQGHLTADGVAGGRILGMEQGGAVVALDDGQAPARPQHPQQLLQDRRRIAHVLQHEADEDVVEAGLREGQGPDIAVP